MTPVKGIKGNARKIKIEKKHLIIYSQQLYPELGNQ